MAGQGADAIVLHIMLGCYVKAHTVALCRFCSVKKKDKSEGGLVTDLLYSYNALYLYIKSENI